MWPLAYVWGSKRVQKKKIGQSIIPPKWFSLSSPQIAHLTLASPKKYLRRNWLVVKISQKTTPLFSPPNPIPGNIARGVFLSAGQKLFLLRHNSRFTVRRFFFVAQTACTPKIRPNLFFHTRLPAAQQLFSSAGFPRELY
ncbi:hypothetical protein CEXT_492531 [Caerostris extrusa]|uniref:Uncharacterized protein n=1 Tax=Caerostris extrusa TaxID=172846 RepID=A0AAV4X8J1_CAEEX|nr:hypothetical protein CEXT_492531 [Caerostris extrusa]